jgi:hypothetical protein
VLCRDVGVVHRAIGIGANGQCASGMFAEHDDGGFGVAAQRLGIRVVGDVEFAVLVFLQRAGTLLFGSSVSRFDGDKFRPRGNLAVDVGRHLGLEARRIKALVALHVCKQAGVETAAARAGMPRNRSFHDLPVHTGIAAKLVLLGPFFKVEQVTEEPEGYYLRRFV